MTVQQRPTDPPLADATWAEGPISTIAGTEVPRKPNQINSGYGNQEPLPHAEFNWLFRSVMRWIKWLVSKVDFHVHDGGATDASVPKVKASQHLDWGINGTVNVTTDTASLHAIAHEGSASTKRIVTGQLRAATIQATGTGAAATVNVRDSGGNNGLLDSAIIKSTNYLQTPTIRSTGTIVNVRDSNGFSATLNSSTIQTGTIQRIATGGTINVRDFAGGNTTLNVNAVQADGHLRTKTIRSVGFSGEDEVVNMRNSLNTNTVKLNVQTVQAENVPKYTARINANGSVAYSHLAVAGAVDVQKTPGPSGTDDGRYEFNFPFTPRVVIITLINDSGSAYYDFTNKIVFTFNSTGGKNARAFSIVVF
jgi:hypothetical protein